MIYYSTQRGKLRIQMEEQVKAVILAAGEGIRMHPLTYTRPKVMLPIANKPILEHLILEIKKTGIEEFIFVVGYRQDAVRDYFGNGQSWGVNIDYVTQRNQLGTAHAIKITRELVDGRFLVVNGDMLVKEQDLKRMMAREDFTLSLIEVKYQQDMGVVEIDGERVVHIWEKLPIPPSNLVNAGIYVLTPDIFPAISDTSRSPRGEYEITDSLQLLIDQGHRLGYEKVEYWLNIGYPWELLVANGSLMAEIEPQNLGIIEENAVINGPVSIGRGTVVRSNSYIQGPVCIGENCSIGPNCYIRPATSIGDDCHIGAAVEVKNSIIMKDSQIPHHNYVGDSVIGEGCNLGAGTKIANLRLDKKDISVMGIETKLRKLGAIIGDGVQVGINASINVGSLIGCNSFIGPGAVVDGIIYPNSKIF
jgi:bifunctional UDP-N-acetylglucosamine pyrophosphorylase/glucosamine-1-phosphate N-acetyltransferase